MKAAWHAGALSQPLKKFPPLSDILGDTVPALSQTPEQMCAAMDAWVSLTRH